MSKYVYNYPRCAPGYSFQYGQCLPSSMVGGSSRKKGYLGSRCPDGYTMGANSCVPMTRPTGGRRPGGSSRQTIIDQKMCEKMYGTWNPDADANTGNCTLRKIQETDRGGQMANASGRRPLLGTQSPGPATRANDKDKCGPHGCPDGRRNITPLLGKPFPTDSIPGGVAKNTVGGGCCCDCGCFPDLPEGCDCESACGNLNQAQVSRNMRFTGMVPESSDFVNAGGSCPLWMCGADI